MNRRFAWLITPLLLACVHLAEAQQPGTVPRIGFVLTTRSQDIAGNRIEAFRQTLRELGYIEGKNIQFEYRYIEGQQDQVPRLISELVKLNVDVLVLSTLTSLRAVKQVTTTVPVVMVTTNDPVATGIIDSLARPGGNITGLTSASRELSGKRIELLKELIPKITRVGVLWDPRGPGPAIAFKEYESAALALKMKIQSLEVREANPDFNARFQAAIKEGASAIIMISSSVLQRHASGITELAIKNRLPSIAEESEYAKAGCLMSYSANDADNYKRAAVYVNKVLKGAKPADLPVEQPTKFELVINLKTAKEIGLTIPPNVLARADRVMK